jgi:methylated-DNA-[protein]-cysteine S-methyltransferase
MRFTIVDCDLGSLVLFARNGRLSRLDVVAGPASHARRLVAEAFPQAEESPAHFATTVGLLRRYIEGEREGLDVPVDLEGLNPFTRRVLEQTRKIPYGKVISYGTIGARLGYPNAARAVGQALHRNPVPVIIPCHRVVKADCSLGGFGLGPEMKIRLLSLEGIEVSGLRKSMISS